MEINAIAQRSQRIVIGRATDLPATTALILFGTDHDIRMFASRPVVLAVRQTSILRSWPLRKVVINERRRCGRMAPRNHSNREPAGKDYRGRCRRSAMRGRPKDMLDIDTHIVNQKTAHFEPEKFEDHYETAL